MRKILIVAAAAAVLGGSALAYTAYAHPGGWRHGRSHYNAADMSAFADARIAAMKAGLALSAEQEKLWPPVESAARELAKKHIEWRDERRAERRDRTSRTDPIEKLRRGADRLSETGADLKRFADAVDPLYASLDDAQKRRMRVLGRGVLDNDRPRFWRRHGDLGDEGRRFQPREERRERFRDRTDAEEFGPQDRAERL